MITCESHQGDPALCEFCTFYEEFYTPRAGDANKTDAATHTAFEGTAFHREPMERADRCRYTENADTSHAREQVKSPAAQVEREAGGRRRMQNEARASGGCVCGRRDTAAQGNERPEVPLSCKTEARPGGGSHLHPLRVADQVLLSR